mgnify:CR=1 FL=1
MNGHLKNQIANPKNSGQLNTTYLINAFNLPGKLTDFTDMVFADFDDIIVRDTVEEWRQTDDQGLLSGIRFNTICNTFFFPDRAGKFRFVRRLAPFPFDHDRPRTFRRFTG